VALAGMLAGTRLTGTPVAAQRIVIFGAGAAGVGIARLLRDTLKRSGVEGEARSAAIACLDSRGLLVDDSEIADEHKREFAWPAALAEKYGLGSGRRRDLLSVVRQVKPTMLIGVCAEPDTFTEPILREMARHVDRPLVFPMSNPTASCEAKPSDVIAWTDGRALVATGSPFDPVVWGGRTIRVGQGNNAFVFPGVGLGVLVAEAREVTDSMFAVAAEELAACVSAEDLATGSLFPRVREMRKLSVRIAEAVVRTAREQGVGRAIPDGEIPAAVAQAMWEPSYLPIVAAPRTAPVAEPALA
jgi:malic enzyme